MTLWRFVRRFLHRWLSDLRWLWAHERATYIPMPALREAERRQLREWAALSERPKEKLVPRSNPSNYKDEVRFLERGAR